ANDEKQETEVDDSLLGDVTLVNNTKTATKLLESEVSTAENSNADFQSVTSEGDGEGDENKDQEEPSEPVRHYLVKWRSLPYEDSTWELEKDVDLDKMQLFMKRRLIKQTKSVLFPLIFL